LAQDKIDTSLCDIGEKEVRRDMEVGSRGIGERRGFSKHLFSPSINSTGAAGSRWLTPIIVATCEAEIRRLMVQVQSQQIVQETLSSK
jgi:hypothetical protein